MSNSSHVAVMTRECMDALKPKSGGRYLDATLGGGTHTAELLRLSEPEGRVLSIDADSNAVRRANERLRGETRWTGVVGNFRDLADIVQRERFVPLDGILMDLGFSSDQLADSSKGISFLADGPLDMRLGDGELTAAAIVNGWKAHEIERVLRDYGEERFAKRIADAILTARKSERIVRTVQLVDIIAAAVPSSYEHGRIHPATRTFQALRVVVNDELGALENAIRSAASVLAPCGRLAIISFHSLEDRIVKHAFRSTPGLQPVTKRPLIPSDEEISNNPRSRSAKLRVAERTLNNPKLKTNNKYQKTLCEPSP